MDDRPVDPRAAGFETLGDRMIERGFSETSELRELRERAVSMLRDAAQNEELNQEAVAIFGQYQDLAMAEIDKKIDENPDEQDVIQAKGRLGLILVSAAIREEAGFQNLSNIHLLSAYLEADESRQIAEPIYEASFDIEETLVFRLWQLLESHEIRPDESMCNMPYDEALNYTEGALAEKTESPLEILHGAGFYYLSEDFPGYPSR